VCYKFQFYRACFQKEKRAQMSVEKWNIKKKKKERKKEEKQSIRSNNRVSPTQTE